MWVQMSHHKVRQAIEEDSVDLLQTYTIDDINASCHCPCALAAKSGSIQCLRYLHETLGLTGSMTCSYDVIDHILFAYV